MTQHVGPIAEAKRKNHLFDFRGGPIVIWTPREADKLDAQLLAARLVQADLGDAELPDPDIVTVDVPTSCLLTMCVREAGEDHFPLFADPRTFMENTTTDEKLQLLNMVIAAETNERADLGLGPSVNDGELLDSLAETDADGAHHLLLNYRREELVLLAHRAAKAIREMSLAVLDLDDEA